MGQSVNVRFFDDDPFVRERVCRDFRDQFTFDGREYRIEACGDRRELMNSIKSLLKQSHEINVVIVDLAIHGDRTAGLEIIREIRKKNLNVLVIAYSNFDSHESILECLQAGADDFISKHTDGKDLVYRVSMAISTFDARRIEHFSPTSAADKTHFSPTMKAIDARAKKIANSAVSTVLVYGESGTGKEIVADIFARAFGDKVPFFRVNCGALSANLVESELFGHVRGAFTGAIADRRGYFEAASGGWIFLDEIATLSAAAQVALLRVLENKEIYRVGSSKSIGVDVRVIAATNEPLDVLVTKGRFRRDLWQRLREVEIDLVPLRDRREEIAGLVSFFCKTMAGGPYRVTETVMEVLENAKWKDGNVRELRNCLRAMTEFAGKDKTLTPMALPKWLWNNDSASTAKEVDPVAAGVEFQPHRDPSLNELRIRLNEDCPDPLNFDYICDAALIALVRKIVDSRKKVSLRTLAGLIGLSRGTVTARLLGAVDRGLITADELQGYFDIQGLTK